MHPTAFTIGGLDIAWYGILLATGFMVGMWTAGRRGLKIGINAEDLSNLMIWLFIGGIAGGKILFVINHLGEIPIKESFLSRAGMVFHGSFIGACLAVFLYTRAKKMPIWPTFDALAPSFALGHAFGRIGCFMTSCCYGKTCELPWAVQFPQGSMPYQAHLNQKLIETNATHSLHVHPTQVYESILNFATYAALAWLFQRRKFDGQVIAAYMLIYAVLRFGLEYLRADGRGEFWFGVLSSGQGISVLLLLGGIVIWILKMDSIEREISKKKRLVATGLCFFIGLLGAHRFYAGKTKTAFIQLFTLGGLGIWAFADLVLILSGRFTDSDDKAILNWE